jgi:hypothetical protein
MRTIDGAAHGKGGKDEAPRRPRSFLRDNGLTIALAVMFLLSIGAMALSGWQAHNSELAEHGAPPLGLLAYLVSGTFASAVFENWESEFLQMAAFVMLTAVLYQRGSGESRDPDGEEEPEPRHRGITGFLYDYSLGIALAALFLLTFLLHLWGSYRADLAEAALHGSQQQSWTAHLGSAQFWFESFQNWQSEFLATAALVVLSIMLRFRGSPESKRVDASNAETGS